MRTYSCVVSADSIIGEKTIGSLCDDTCDQSDYITGVDATEQAMPSNTPTVQVIEWILLDVVTPIEDIILVEDASGDEEVVS